MNIPDKDMFLKESCEALCEMLENTRSLKPLDSASLDKDKTALVIIDMVNGFVKEGSLCSPRIEAIVPRVVRTAFICSKRLFKIIAFADCHDDDSAEFSCYPPHCVKGTEESQLIDELKLVDNIELIEKNSTNGFHEDVFNKWIKENKDINNFIVTGDCTDICVLQFTLSLKAYFNKRNLQAEVIVPVDSVETFELGIHKGDLMNLVSLFLIESSGVKLVSEII